MAVGLAVAWLSPDHSVTPERLTGTVTFSNQNTRTILFESDGSARGTFTQYSVVGDNWTDAGGTRHDGGYPDCLSSKSPDTVRTDRRHVELAVVYPNDDSRKIAISVRCFD